MASTKVYTPTSELPTNMNEAAEDSKSTTDCGVPGCFTCANGDKHAPLLTPFHEFLLMMQTHKEALRRGMANNKARIAVLEAERLDTDLESGHDELRELEQVIYDYEHALEGAENNVAHVRRAEMFEDGSDSEEEEEKEEEEEEEEEEEMEEEMEEEEEEEESDDEFELAKDKDSILDHLASEYQPSHADLLASKLADLLVKSVTDEENVEGDATPAQV